MPQHKLYILSMMFQHFSHKITLIIYLYLTP